jgi:hypothetical protein
MEAKAELLAKIAKIARTIERALPLAAIFVVELYEMSG